MRLSMYAVEFETDIKSKCIEIKDYSKVFNKRAKVIVLVEDSEMHAVSTNQNDSLIVASASLEGCQRLYSEDMQHGMVLSNQMMIVNPFIKT